MSEKEKQSINAKIDLNFRSMFTSTLDAEAFGREAGRVQYEALLLARSEAFHRYIFATDPQAAADAAAQTQFCREAARVYETKLMERRKKNGKAE